MGLKILLPLSLLLIAAIPSSALDLGGELELTGGLHYGDSWITDLQGRTLVEFFLPEQPPFAARFAVEGFLNESSSELGIKYLYLRWRGEHGQFTVGRQPVAWGYGAMLNPLGYGLDIEGLAGQSVTPAVDGFRYVHSLGAGRRFELVMDYPDGLTASEWDQLGFGGRLRWPSAGQDFSFNVSSQPLTLPLGPEPDAPVISERVLRTGVTYRGDAGPVGLYGALGYVRLQEAAEYDVLLQIGLDTSWEWGPAYQKRPVILQAEYLRFLRGQLSPGLLLQLDSDELEQNLPDEPAEDPADMNDLLLLNIAVNWDYFTQFGAALLLPLGPGPKTAAPYYITDLGGDVELRIQGDVARLNAGSYQYGVRASLTRFF